MKSSPITVALLCLFVGFPFSPTATTTMGLVVEDEAGGLVALERAKYHLGELHKNMAQFTAHPESSFRTKRDQGRALEMLKSDFLFNSLLDFCYRIQNYSNLARATKEPSESVDNSTMTTTANSTLPTTTTAPTSTNMTYAAPTTTAAATTTPASSITTNLSMAPTITYETSTAASTNETTTMTTTTTTTETTTSAPLEVTKNETTEEPPDAEQWEVPEVHPFNIVAVSDRKQVHLLVHVNHSVSVQMKRVAGFDSDSEFLPNVVKSRGMIQSLAIYHLETAAYCKEHYEMDNVFLLESLSRSGGSVKLTVDICASINESLQKNETNVMSEFVDLPRLRIDSPDPKLEVTVTPGQNASLDLTVKMGPKSLLSISGVFHDRPTKTMLKEEYLLGFSGLNDDVLTQRVDPGGDSPPQLFSVTASPVNETSEGETTQSGDQNGTDSAMHAKRRSVSVRVQLFTDSGQRTGKLYVQATEMQGSEDGDSPLVKSVSVRHVIRVKKAKKKKVFPRRRVYMESTPTFYCNEEGNVNTERHGVSCTLFCVVVGRSLRSISITKEQGQVLTFRELIHQDGDRLVAMVDVGRASSDVSGSYLCTAIDSKGGEHRKKLHLVANYLKTSMDKPSIIDLGNETSLVTCNASGTGNIAVSVELSLPSKQLRIDNWNTSIRNETKAEHGVILSVELPTDELRYPAYSLTCLATGMLGNANSTLYLSDVIKRNKTLRPKMITEKSNIEILDNGMVAVTCTCVRSSRLKAMASISGGSAVSTDLDDVAFEVKVDMRVKDSPTITWLADIKNLLDSGARLYCVATNGHGVDYYKLPSPRTLSP